MFGKGFKGKMLISIFLFPPRFLHLRLQIQTNQPGLKTAKFDLCYVNVLDLNKFVPPMWLSAERVKLITCGCEFDPRLRRTFFPAYIRLSPLQKHLSKVVSGFGKKLCVSVSTSVGKPGNTCTSLMVLNPNTTNQLDKFKILLFCQRVRQ